MRKTVLLTGGFGNLGGRLSAFLNQLHLFNIRLGSRVDRKTPNWAPDAQTTKLDVLDTASLKTSLLGVDTVIHLAAMNDIECANNPEFARIVNVEGTRNLLESSIAAGVNRIVFLSTAHVYAMPLVGTIDELTNPIPQHTYSITKFEAEQIVKKVHEDRQIIGIRVRCANGFGAPMDPKVNIWQILIDDLCRQATESGMLTLRSHGNQERNFVPLHDVCMALFHLINLESQSVGDGLFNLGHKDSASVWNMAQLIANRCEEVLGFTPPINRPPAKSNEYHQSLNYRSDKLRETGFVPRGDLNTEIDDLLRFCAKEFPRRS